MRIIRIFPVVVVLLFVFETATCYVEMLEENGLENTTMLLTCIHLDSIIAIHKVIFEPTEENSTFNGNQELRESLNHRCSGVNHCSFILNVDCPSAYQWGSGRLAIRYACISDAEIIKYCNKNITLPRENNPESSEAYVYNPGYPKFYLGQKSCKWIISVPSYQRIKVTILDLSLFGNSEDCRDQLVIKDTGQPLYSSCHREDLLVDVISATDSLEVVLNSSETLVPRRGVLFYFSAVGCETPEPPSNGYLISKNDSVAVFGCCADFGFSDTNQRTKVLRCNGYKWDLQLPMVPCDTKRTVTEIEGHSAIRITHEYNMQELIAPIVLIVLLFGINAIVLFIIFQYRKRKNASAVCNEEELKTFSVTVGGSQTA